MTAPQPFAALARWCLSWWQVLFLGAQILVLAFSPSSYTPAHRHRLYSHMVAGTGGMLLWFTVFAALVTVVLTRIVVVTAQSYGLTQYALQVIIRVLVIELIPLCAVLFVGLRGTLGNAAELTALRRQGHLQAMQHAGDDPLATQALPRVLAGLHASLTLAALSCVVAVVLVYLAVYGLSLAALPAYTRLFGQIFDPGVTLIFVLKTLFFSLVVAIMPVASALHAGLAPSARADSHSHMVARMFLALLLMEVLCLVGNYY